jgi:SAM-dependent methyltransferase
VKEDAAAYWDERYRSRDAGPREPAKFLTENLGLLPPTGSVLDVAMGTGRHALFLAGRGYEVTGVDISPVAVQRCLEEASRLGVRIEAICADLMSWQWPSSAFDIVLDFYFLQRDLCPRMAAALRPGGILVFETFTTDQRQFGWGPTEDGFLLRPGELPALFPTLHVVRYREAIVTEDDRGPKAVASLLARKRP